MSVRPLAVLLVDDSPEDRKQIQQVMGQVSFAIQLAVLDNPVEALDCLRAQGAFEGTNPPDVVLLDLDLADGDGRTLLAELKEDEHAGGIPIIAMSEDEGDAVRASELGVHAFVKKPLTADEFMRVVSFTQSVS